MRHKSGHRKLNRTKAHRRALFANLAKALIEHEQITTTLPKAKALRPVIEKLLTRARKGNLAARRDLISRLQSEQAVEKLIGVLGPRYRDRPGGYTRIIRAGFRYGDDAPLAIIEFVERDVQAKGAKDIAAQEA